MVTANLDITLNAFGQQADLHLYTQLCFCYAAPDPAQAVAAVTTIRSGLACLAQGLPWIAGQVVCDAGVYKITPLAPAPALVIKDVAEPSMADMVAASFPFRMLDEGVFAPRNTFPGHDGPTPVFLVQATHVPGGLVLAILSHHQATDMTGQGVLMRLLDKACRGEALTSTELADADLAKAAPIPTLDPAEDPAPEPVPQKVRPAPPAQIAAPSPPPPSTWGYFTFSADALAALKAHAMEAVPAGFVSTDDALCALVWQALARARLPRLDAAAPSTFARAVDPRRYVGLPAGYPGLVQNMAYSTRPLGELATGPLGAVAAQLRAAVDPATSGLGRATRALPTALQRAPGATPDVTAALDLARGDIMLSSWAGVQCAGLDFGLGLGTPLVVRRPQFTPVESLAYFMPRAMDGEIALGICLRGEDLARLKGDEEFTKYGRLVQ
jgi:hypothetical protein